ncbi:hypothetical protein Sme01_02070 [Sphaerisporangium melleum]|uniref:ABC transporter permease n=2 Tax=Sphaerisporangium melleum TaxID=321316 RepID=A0A917VJY0_9ACTN|nr:hypothetical protein GCM10007964_34400 [Sphaerisporangium melleum]GII67731.1 hypothetical protein Sme01_02070 [Sphaerisporangium melleum]
MSGSRSDPGPGRRPAVPAAPCAPSGPEEITAGPPDGTGRVVPDPRTATDAGEPGGPAVVAGAPETAVASGAMPVARLRPGVLALALTVFAVCALAGLLVGAAGLPVRGVVLELLGRLPFVTLDSGLSPVERGLLLQLRMPRVVLAAVVGGLLALAGAGYQGVFRNPLADPYLLGAAAGAGLTATLVIALVPSAVGMVPIAAFAGAVGGVLLAYALGTSTARGGGTATLVLAGVAVSSFLSALQAFVQQMNYEQLQRIYVWILGGIAGDWSQVWLIAPYAVVSSVVMIAHGRLLDVLSVGDDEAVSLGVNAARVRLVVLCAASLATASAVAVSGLIGFVGIVVPHVVRRLAGGSYRVVLPVSLLAGAAFLVLADLVARTALAPAELPIGVVTAFIGAPFFIGVLRATRAVET